MSAMQIRRIVTGHDAEGRAVVLSDAPVQGHDIPGGAATFALIWKTVSHPVDNDDATDRSGACRRQRHGQERSSIHI